MSTETNNDAFKVNMLAQIKRIQGELEIIKKHCKKKQPKENHLEEELKPKERQIDENGLQISQII